MLEVVLAACGLLLLLMRMTPRPQPSRDQVKGGGASHRSEWPNVSIIIPARNEAHNLPRLLASLKTLDYPVYEVIVVDDESLDQTADCVLEYMAQWNISGRNISGRHQTSWNDVDNSPTPQVLIKDETLPLSTLTLVRGKKRPLRDVKSDKFWNGKQWACHQGAMAATGQVLLFTDADTIHCPQSLKTMVNFLLQTKAGLVSTLPYHIGDSWWERLMGPFHIFLLAMTNPFGEPNQKRLYAIGQYLLFTKEAYLACGGHEAVSDTLVEDIPLAHRILTAGQDYRVFTPYLTNEAQIFKVKMYQNLGEFFSGWRRNFRAGFAYGTVFMGVDAFLMFAAITGTGMIGRILGPTLIAAITVCYLIWAQRRLGRLSPAGPLIFPFALGCFCLITVLALFDTLLKRDQVWKGRKFSKVAS